MDFSPVELPSRIAMGMQRRAGWSTTVVQVIGGQETAIPNWSRARHSFDLSYAVRTRADYDDVVQHFHSVRGRSKKFLLRDPLDYKVEAARGVLLDDGGAPPVVYQLAKTYGAGADIYRRIITRPRLGYVTVFRLRAAVLTDITASATITFTTGTMTFAGGAVIAGDVLSWSGQFDVPCRYDTDELPGIIVDRKPGAAGDLLVQCDSIPIVEVRDP